MADSSGLSDVLRNLAEGEAAPPPVPPRKAKAPPPPVSAAKNTGDDDDEVLVAEVDEPETPGRAAASGAATPAARRRAPAPAPTSHTLKEAGACLFTTFSVLMLLWAVWGTLVLMGFEIWRSDEPDSRTMAKVALVFYPLALIGLGYAAFLFYQISQAKKKAAQPRRKR